MQKRHYDREKYFFEQSLIAEKIVLPYITTEFPVSSSTSILEVGCGEAGNLFPFLERGCKATGIDRSPIRIDRAEKYYSHHPQKENLTLIARDIFDVTPHHTGTFDLIIIRDSLEHIRDQEKLFEHIRRFINPSGHIFVSFPPWRMPFGGHQQMCHNKFISRLPYLHLLPKTLFVSILKLVGEKEYRIEELLQIRSTRLGIETFRRLVATHNMLIEREDFYLINPAYKIKFNLKPQKLPGIINVAYLRDFYTTACYFLLSPE
jgi:SAM-dependent methyltransferase